MIDELLDLGRLVSQDPLTMEQVIARIAELSVSQLERQFYRVFQLAPHRFLVKLRLERAAGLLDGRDSIAAIAQTCGYADHSAFTRQFRAVVGVTPRDYRRLRHQRYAEGGFAS